MFLMCGVMLTVDGQCKAHSFLPLRGFKKKMLSKIVDAAIVTKRSIPSPTLRSPILCSVFHFQSTFTYLYHQYHHKPASEQNLLL